MLEAQIPKIGKVTYSYFRFYANATSKMGTSIPANTILHKVMNQRSQRILKYQLLQKVSQISKNLVFLKLNI